MNDDGRFFNGPDDGGGGVGHNSRNKKKERVVKKSIIDHSYRDYSQTPVSEDVNSLVNGRRKTQSFPAKLHEICSDPEYRHIISWL